MVLFYLHFINVVTLAAAIGAYFFFPHLWEDQGVLFLTLVTITSNCLSMLALGVWAMATQSSGSGKVAVHAFIALTLAGLASYTAYRVGMEYHFIAYFQSKWQ